MKRTGNKRFRFLLLSLLLVLFPALYLMDRYDVPSRLLTVLPAYEKRMMLTLRPIIVSDAEIFQSISDSPLIPEHHGDAAFRGNPAAEWNTYRKLRTAHFSSKLILDPLELKRQIESLEKRHPEEKERILARADDFTEDLFAPFDTNPLKLGRDFRWTDYPSRGDDPIFIWEINTLQHFPILAEAYLFTGNAKYLNAISRHLDSWNDENPIGNSVNWKSVMEVSLRLYSLAWTGELLVHDASAAHLFPGLTKTMYGHARYVFQNIDSPRGINNHGILSAMGLYFWAVNYPEFSQAKEWKEFSERRMLDDLSIQYTPRGVHKEYSLPYHKLLLDGYLHYLVVKRKLHEPVPSDVLEKFQRQARYLRFGTGPDGAFFPIGDSSDHYFLRLGNTGYSDAVPTLALASLLFSDSEISVSRETADWEAMWVLGHGLHAELSSALQRSGPRTVPADDGLRVYAEEGFFRIDSGKLVLFGKLGRLGGERVLSGHSHGDISSFVLWNDGKPIAIDPGTYSYRRSSVTRGIVWRDFLRSSMSHNVTSVDSKSQAEPIGDFGYKEWPGARLLFAEGTKDFFLVGGQHDAYRERVGRAVRVFGLFGKRLLVLDWYPESMGSHAYETNLLFGTGDATMTEGNTVRASGVVVQWVSGQDNAIGRLLTGDYESPGGWYSTSYGTLGKTAQFRGGFTAFGPTVSALLFDLSAENGDMSRRIPMTVKDLGNGAYALVMTRTGGDPIAVIVNSAKDRLAKPASYNGWTTDAQIAAFRTGTGGRALIFDGSYLHPPAGVRSLKVHIMAGNPEKAGK